jgi:hypothetical protein
MTPVVVLGALLATAGTVVAWLPRVGRSRDVAVVAVLVGAAVLGCAAALPGTPVDPDEDLGMLLPAGIAVVTVLGGGPVTAVVLRVADREASGSVAQAAAVLRGGAWIGVFERIGIFAALVAGWPEGIAVVLALKGLGRYSELRGDVPPDGAPGGALHGGAAERFIIGTFCSALWAAGGAGVLVGLL